jgi:ribulose-5-phosphate 4-epimerase/fuculose-1-phosphate aldolase
MRKLVAALFVACMLVLPQRAMAQAGAPAALDAAIEDLVAASRILANEGVLDAYGHVSVRHPSDPNRYLMARSLAPALITAADILQFDLNSSPVTPTAQRMFTERFIHGSIYQARPDVKAIVHSHSPTVIPFGISDVPLRPVFHLGAFLYGGVPVFEISEFTGDGEMLVRTPQLGDALAKTLGDKRVALMRGHGNVVVGPNLRVAVARAVFTDENARMQSTALALGGPINYISPEEGAKRDREPGDPSRAWELWKALAMKKAPAN